MRLGQSTLGETEAISIGLMKSRKWLRSKNIKICLDSQAFTDSVGKLINDGRFTQCIEYTMAKLSKYDKSIRFFFEGKQTCNMIYRC